MDKAGPLIKRKKSVAFTNTNRFGIFADVLNFQFQGGGHDGHLLNLASRFSGELGMPYLSVLQQLEDLRLAEWSEVTPPAPPPNAKNKTAMETEPTVYVNYNPGPTNKSRHMHGDPIYVPGTYTVRRI
jgi:hypothetical protein